MQSIEMPVGAGGELATPAATPSWFRGFLQRNGSRTLLVGLILFLIILAAALAAPLLTEHQPSRNNITSRLRPPFWDTEHRGSTTFLLGTDGLGRDMLTRILYGIRVSLALAGAGLALSLLLGVTVGLVSGLFGGWVDLVLMRIVDLQLAFPYIVLAMAIVTATHTSIPILIVLLGLAGWVYFARVVRGIVLQEMQKDYVKAAQVLGAGRIRVGLRYVFPNVLPSVAVIATLQFPGLVIFEATLSFLGLGMQPPTPSLGGMMLDGTQYIASAWWVITLPGLAVLLTTLSLNLMSDGLRQLLDPRLQTV
ncbi:MAG: ABC transporter permease [Thermomicrobiales bacterium]|nr:ABC transporter permease [Thermomicrobiales bacterium]